jgi:hypothetical protein
MYNNSVHADGYSAIESAYFTVPEKRPSLSTIV